MLSVSDFLYRAYFSQSRNKNVPEIHSGSMEYLQQGYFKATVAQIGLDVQFD